MTMQKQQLTRAGASLCVTSGMLSKPRPRRRRRALPLLQQFLFLKQKCRSLFNQRKRPAKLAWTTLYRKQHRKVRGRGGELRGPAALGRRAASACCRCAAATAWAGSKAALCLGSTAVSSSQAAVSRAACRLGMT